MSILANWISAIDFLDWPQQRKIDYKLRPAMVSDLGWHRFGEITDPTVSKLMEHFPGRKANNRLLSVVMPRHNIDPHKDLQGFEWHCRVHVPLTSNDKCYWVERGAYHFMKPGIAYKVDTTSEHSVVNNGDTPRIHLMFDVV